MDGQRFDDLARVLSATLNRKGFLAIIAGVAAPAALSDAGAARKRKPRNRGNGGNGDVDPEGANGGACSGFCTKDAECPDSPDCICDLETNRCQTVLCGGSCLKDGDCQDFPGCSCFGADGPENPGACGIDDVCQGFCNKGLCARTEGDSCVCDSASDLCVTIACPGFCEDNDDCTEQGADNCVCFLGVDVVAPVGVEGVEPSGACGACLGAAAECSASTECCGQLVCQAGRCQRKQKPKKRKKRCASSGKDCTQDLGCCAQAICYRGQCGEKDTHCDSDNECARGYSCVGGRLTGGHRRCRRNRRKPPRNRRNRG